MAVEILNVDTDYLFGLISKYLARDDASPRHDYGHLAGDPRAVILEAWRFPFVDAYFEPGEESQTYNAVTFVYAPNDKQTGQTVELTGSFAELHTPIPLTPIENTHFYTLTLKQSKGEVHYYRFRVNGEWLLDPINPQQTRLDNGVLWSRFFTWGATQRLSLERWEAKLLERLCSHILPFHTQAGENFFDRIHDSQGPENRPGHAYRLDESIGAVNYIDKLLAKEEAHHLIDYQICLGLIDQLLRMRNPVAEPWHQTREAYAELYEQMSDGNVPNWNYDRYGNPRYFLQLLRRHTLTGAFSHPRYGGNAMALGWKYLEERYIDPANNKTLFDWKRAIEAPYGRNATYRG